MDKRYQVFVSSTYVDLQEERQEVIQALLELDCIPAGMELFPAADEDQWTLIKKVIDDCDYYIVIIGGRYGSVSPSGLSYTQMEYEYAVSQGKPVIGFIHREPGSIPASKTEQSEEGKLKLKAFCEIVQKKVCKHWMTSSELGSVVSRSLVKLIKNKPAIGWVRANLLSDEASSKEVLRLKTRIEELEILIERTGREAPEGTEYLSQGDDPFDLNYSYLLLGREFDDKEQCTRVFPTTWDDIFRVLSPYMIEEASEPTLKAVLQKYVQSNVMPTLEDMHKCNIQPGFNLQNFFIDDDDFQTIKVQLRSLGLIVRSVKLRADNDHKAYWSLTPYGDNVMTRLRAIKKSAQVVS